jgi:hypothetical protein
MLRRNSVNAVCHGGSTTVHIPTVGRCGIAYIGELSRYTREGNFLTSYLSLRTIETEVGITVIHFLVDILTLICSLSFSFRSAIPHDNYRPCCINHKIVVEVILIYDQ